MRSGFVRFLARPWALRACIALALLLASPALVTGLAGDDHFHALVLTGNRELPTVPRHPMSMFTWATGDPAYAHSLMELGLTGWWTNPQMVMAFYRPISVATHWLDYRLWPSSPWAMHLHSLLWFGVALLFIGTLYRRVLSTDRVAPLVPALALLVYAVDDSHGMTLAWIANRNAITALALGAAALVLHDRGARGGELSAAIAAPGMLAAALLAGESALAATGYLFAHALFLDRRRGALLRLWPYAAVVVLWSGFYRAAGYGARGSGLVVDPGSEPLRFLSFAVERVPVLLAAEVGLPPSDGWEAYPMIAPWLRPAMFAWALLLVALFVLASAGLLRSSAPARFFALGTLLAALPVSAQFPHDRLLLFIGVGAAPLIALLIASVLQGSAAGVLQRGAGYACLGLHLVLAPLLLPLRVLAPMHGERMVTAADRSLPATEAVREQTLVLMNPPVDAFAGFLPPARSAQRRPVPRAVRWLATGTSEVTIERIDARTLRVRPAGGFLAQPSERMQRDPQDRLPVGHRIRYSDLTVEISAETADLRPAEILARFEAPLEDPRYAFFEWRGLHFVPFVLPAIGERRVLPRVDMMALLR